MTAVFTVPATLDHWHDADTLVANLDLGWHVGLAKQPIRLARCDAPELATPAGKLATAYVLTMLRPGEKFTLVSHSLDKYGRVLGDVKLADGRDVADVLIANGYAVPYDGGAR